VFFGGVVARVAGGREPRTV